MSAQPADDQRTCLHLAASEGALSVVESLISHGSPINQLDRWGGTPLRDAVRGGHGKVAQRLYRGGGNLGYTEAQASAELCHLARCGDLNTIKLMLACGADVDVMDYDKRTPL